MKFQAPITDCIICLKSNKPCIFSLFIHCKLYLAFFQFLSNIWYLAHNISFHFNSIKIKIVVNFTLSSARTEKAEYNFKKRSGRQIQKNLKRIKLFPHLKLVNNLWAAIYVCPWVFFLFFKVMTIWKIYEAQTRAISIEHNNM